MRTRPACRRETAFTLVELLVVIGIIALLISILLPALNSARRQAAQTKCMSAMKQIFNAYQLYSIDSKGYYPPAKLMPAGSYKYNIDGDDFPGVNGSYGPFWFNFVSKYVQKAKMGEADTGGTEISTMRNRSVLWGCPAFAGYDSVGAGADVNTKSLNRVQIGYGMNAFPTYTQSYPAITAGGPFGGGGSRPDVPEKQAAFTQYADSTDPNASGGYVYWDPVKSSKAGFVKQTVWGKQGALRALIADGSLWLLQSNYASGAPFPAQFNDANANITGAQTTASMWRHGKLPARAGTSGVWSTFDPTKGKMAYNILYCDGHVASSAVPKDAFESVRMRYPG
jgi:prepilin-type processing-associated H-X9-DG protein